MREEIEDPVVLEDLKEDEGKTSRGWTPRRVRGRYVYWSSKAQGVMNQDPGEEGIEL